MKYKEIIKENKGWILYVVAIFAFATMPLIQCIFFTIQTDNETRIMKEESQMNQVKNLITSVCLDYQDFDTRNMCVDRMIVKAKEINND